MTHDINGALIQAGDIVEIKNAYFKNDNGFWFVEEDGTDESYLGKDLVLKKIGKTGKVSTSKGNIAFWPLAIFTSDSYKRAAGNAWNKENATIELASKVKNDQVIDFFKSELAANKEQIEYYEIRGYAESFTEPHRKKIEYCERTLKRIG